ncbi:hypothetical protein [Sphingomonas carotinifaciens]|uniref:Uncharacterized protein n=2 Tax=Sphingomonas carotinifaciens TaxID=1166323 RepID=A0A1G7NHB8_9SPHN|nr:hypothetical protein [Sphingomonas carotinifaciens]MWC43235.1 hypothetical protein [Sphingomonas carotinifaciens]SDF73464.1 hypothetical protein SAMN05216557_105168 [Sphingomonas carotinifaciens]
MQDPDLSFVEPARRAEIARRIAEVEEYLRAPGAAAAERAAARLGLGLSSFRMLVRVWTRSHRAEELSGATHRRSVSRRPDAPTIAQLSLIRGTEASMPNDVLLEKVVAQVYANAESFGAPMPSRPTVRAYASSFRRERLAGVPAGVGIAIDHCAVDVLVSWEGKAVLPIATLALDLERRGVLGVALDPVRAGPRTTAAALLDAVSRIEAGSAARADAVPIEIERDGRPEWDELLDVVEAHGLTRSGGEAARLPGGLRTIRLLGKDVNGVRFKARTTHRKPEGRIGEGCASDVDDALKFLRSRLIRSEIGGPLAGLTGPVRTALALDLKRLTLD